MKARGVDPSVVVRIADVPVHDRPRERLVALGVGALTDAELVALVLRSGSRGQGASVVGADLIAARGLSELARARPEDIARHPGVGIAKAAGLVAAFELGRRAARTTASRPRIRTPDDVADAARPYLAQAARERVLVVVCDGANRLKQVVIVSEGSIDRALVPVREVLNAVLRHDGRAFALAHNHPSGDLEPSDADRRATTDVAVAAKTSGLRFLGHVIVGPNNYRTIS